MMRITNYVYFRKSFVCCQLCCFFLWWIYAVTSLVVCFVALLRLFLNPWHTWRPVRRCKILRSDMFSGLTFWSPLTLLVVALTLQMWSSFCSCILQKKLCSIFIGLAELDVLGQGGTCITFYDASQRKLVQRIRSLTNHDFAMLPLPGPVNIHNASVSRLLDQIFSALGHSFQSGSNDIYIYIYITWYQWYQIRYCYCCDLLWFGRPVNSWAGNLMRSAKIVSCFDVIWCEAFQPEEYEQVMEEASQLLEEQGPQALATAMAILDSRHADLQRGCGVTAHLFSVEERATFAFWRMIPDHSIASTEGEARRIVAWMHNDDPWCTSWIVLIDIDCTYGIDALATPWRKDM